jgi:putative flippase GtrA
MLMLGLAQYGRFLMVGAVVAVLTIACRELIGHFLGPDTPVFYSVSVVCAYGLGILLSFVLNRRFTFMQASAVGWAACARFIAIALLGMFLTWTLSIALRYGLMLQPLLGDASAGLAFALAALLSSGVTYPLNARLVFHMRERRTS